MTIYSDHLNALDNETPDLIHDIPAGYYTLRTQQHGDVFHVCLMTREGDRVGPWITTNDADQAANHIAFLELYAMIESGRS